MADNGPEHERWKSRYFESLEQLETKERDWREADQLLRRGLGRVALISQGVDETLDVQLKKLRTALQNGAEAMAINEIVERISARMKLLDEHGAGHGAHISAPDVLLQVVEAVNFPRAAIEPVRLLKKRLAAADGATPLKPLIDEFAGLLVSAFRVPESEQEPGAAPQEGRRGLLQRLFNREERPGDGKGADAGDETALVAAPLPPQAAVSFGAAAQALPPAPAQLPDRAVEDVFLEILESIVFPPQFIARVQQLKEQLTKGIPDEAIQPMTESVVALVVEMRSKLEHEKEELELFLQQLTQRLNELDAMVGGAESHRLASLAGGRQLHEIVKEQVSTIEETVQGASDINHMKSAIQVSLDKIRQHLAEQRDQEEQRQVSLAAQLKGLTAKLQQMEAESQQLKQRLARERLQALTDPLTGAPNRLAFEQRIAQEFARWQRYKHPLTMVVCDVDHFKKINDTYGHKAGDRALMAIVKTIQFHLRETDFLARVGGEEFVVLLCDTTLEDCATVAEKLRKSVEMSEFVYQGTPVPVTISGGFAQFQPGDTVDEVYQRADKALYRAKRNGRNRFVADGS